MKFTDYFPAVWRDTVTTDDCATLSFLGRDNLEAMLQTWNTHAVAISYALKTYSKKGRDSKMRNFLVQEKARAEFAIPSIEEALKTAEPKPILMKHRPPDYFCTGETIYAYAQDDDFPELSGARYKKVKVEGIEDGRVKATMSMRNGYYFDIVAKIKNPTFMKIDELKALKSDERYRAFWITNVTTDDLLIETIDRTIMGTRTR